MPSCTPRLEPKALRAAWDSMLMIFHDGENIDENSEAEPCSNRFPQRSFGNRVKSDGLHR